MLNLSEPYKNICTIKDLSYGKSNMLLLWRLSKSLRRKEAKVGQCRRKCSDVSKLFLPHRQNGSIVSLKLCRNLCSRKWLRPKRMRVNNFNPFGWWTLYISAGLGRIKLSSARLKISSEEEFFMLRPSLFQFKKQEGKKCWFETFSSDFRKHSWAIWTKTITASFYSR